MTDVSENTHKAGTTLLKMLEKWLMMAILLTHKTNAEGGMFVIPFGNHEEIKGCIYLSVSAVFFIAYSILMSTIQTWMYTT